MLKKLLGLDESQDVDQIELAFRGGWIGLVLIFAAIAFAIFLYKKENSVTPKRRIAMVTLQIAALLTLIIVIMQPFARIRMTKEFQRSMAILLDTSRSMTIEDPRTTDVDVEEAAKALNKFPLDRKLRGDEVNGIRQTLGSTRRIDLARGALSHPDINLIEDLEKNYEVRFFTPSTARSVLSPPRGWTTKRLSPTGSRPRGIPPRWAPPSKRSWAVSQVDPSQAPS